MAHVLIIEPDTVLASIIRQYLLGMDFDVSLSHTAQKAIIHSDQNRPDMVVLELAIPDHNGVEFLQEFRSYADWTDIPVVIYSHIPPEDAGLSPDEWRQHGVDHYLYKPATGLAHLAKVLQRIDVS